METILYIYVLPFVRAEHVKLRKFYEIVGGSLEHIVRLPSKAIARLHDFDR